MTDAYLSEYTKAKKNDPKWMTEKLKKSFIKQKTLCRKMLNQNTYATSQYKQIKRLNKKASSTG